MAIIFLGSSKCAICEQVLAEGEKIVGFPAFTSNLKDDLYKFSDSAVHATCLETHHLRTLIQKVRDTMHKYVISLPCIVDGTLVDRYGGIYFDFITSDEREELYQYNFKGVSVANLPAWTGRQHFIALLEKFRKEGKYVGYNNYDEITNLIQRVTP